MGNCRYFQQTWRGERCVLMEVEEWRRAGDRYLQHCRTGGAGCPVYSAASRLLSSGKRK